MFAISELDETFKLETTTLEHHIYIIEKEGYYGLFPIYPDSEMDSGSYL